jgi:hypothetical protein
MFVPRPDHHGRRRIGVLAALVWIAAVVAISLVTRARADWVASLAASPDRVREGKLWFLVSSGMLVDHPIGISLVFFVALATLVLAFCGVSTFWWAAFLGQVATTVLVYAVIGAVRWFVPAALESVVASPDYGVSTISAAWLGASAAASWRGRGRTMVGRFSIALSCATVGVFAYSVRPELGVLSSEHLIAFGLGIASASPGFWRVKYGAIRRIARPRTKPEFTTGRRNRAWIAIVAGVPAVLAIIVAPAGLAALRGEIVSRIHPTVTRCALDWNNLRGTPRTTIARQPSTFASLTTTRVTIRRGFSQAARPPVWIDYCRYVFVRKREATVVLGMWRHGRVESWTLTAQPRPAAPRHGDASVGRDARLSLHPRGSGLKLTS